MTEHSSARYTYSEADLALVRFAGTCSTPVSEYTDRQGADVSSGLSVLVRVGLWSSGFAVLG